MDLLLFSHISGIILLGTLIKIFYYARYSTYVFMEILVAVIISYIFLPMS